jgi:hypothetical protein
VPDSLSDQSACQYRTKIRRRPDGTGRWDVWCDRAHVAGGVESSYVEAMHAAALYLQTNAEPITRDSDRVDA